MFESIRNRVFCLALIAIAFATSISAIFSLLNGSSEEFLIGVVLAAVAIFVTSTLVKIVLGYHKKEKK